MGKPVGEMSARGYHGGRQQQLLGTVLDCLAELRGTYDAVICEGAGSPAEINLRRTDIVNMGIARDARLPVLVVGDIDRGGVFASFFGTVALLSPEDQALVAGFLVNKFRGDVSLLEPGPRHAARAHRAAHVRRAALPARARHRRGGRAAGLAARDGPGVGRRPARRRGRAAGRRLRGAADVQLHRRGRARRRTGCRRAVRGPRRGAGRRRPRRRARDPGHGEGAGVAAGARASPTPSRAGPPRGGPVLGICGGFQILGEHIEDEVESRRGHVDGLGLLPVRVRFAREKTLTRPVGEALGEHVEGYEIHHGVADVTAAKRSSPMTTDTAWTAAGSARPGARTGTARWSRTGSGGRSCARWRPPRAAASYRPPDTSFAALREEQLDRLGDLIEEHADTDALWRLIESGAPQGLPFIPPGAPA